MDGGKKFNFWEWIADVSMRYSRLILIFAGLLTIFSYYLLAQTEIITDPREWNHRDSKKLIEQIERDFDEGGYLNITFESQHESPSNKGILSPESLKQQFRIIQAIKEKFDVKSESLVDGINSALLRNKRKSILEATENDIGDGLLALSDGRIVMDLEKVSEHNLSHPEIVHFYTKFHIVLDMQGGGGPSQFEHRVPFVKAVRSRLQLKAGLSTVEQKKTKAAIRELAESMQTPDLKVYLFSDYLMTYDIDLPALKNGAIMGLILFTIDIFLLWAVLRTKSAVALTLVLVSLAATWTFGLANLLGIKLSALHTIVLPILLGTGIDDDIVFQMRLAEEMRKRNSFQQAMRYAWRATGLAIFLTTFATLVGFMSGCVTSMSEGLFSFNLLVSISMVIDLFATTFLQGAIRTELARRGRLPVPQPNPKLYPLIDNAVKGLSRLGASWFHAYGRRIILICGVVFLLSCLMFPSIKREFSRKIWMEKGMSTYTADKKMDGYFGLRDHGYILIEGDVENPELLKKMRLLEDGMSDIPLVEKVLGKANVESINELIDKKRIRIKPTTDVREVFDQITENDETANYVKDKTFQEETRHLVHKSGDKYDGLIMKFFVEGGEAETAVKTVKLIEREIERLEFDEIPNINIKIGGGEVSTFLDIKYFFTNLFQSFFLSFVVNFLALLFVWRRFCDCVLAMVPILVAVVITFGLMPILGVKLNVLNIFIAAIVIGVGIDYPIHIIERFREEWRDGAIESRSALQTTLSKMGPNIFGGAITTIFGFGISIITAYPVLLSFGYLTALSIVFCYLGSIFLLPVLLLKWYGRKETVNR